MSSQIEYNKLAKPGSFIAEYMAQFESIETAYAYDFWSACWLISNAVGRGITIPRPKAPVFFNLYGILCADAGITRKSTAVRHAVMALRSYIDQYRGNLPLLTGTVTPEALDAVLANCSINGDDAHCAIAVSELVSFLGKDKYTAGMPGKLTDLYDCPASHKRETISKGSLEAKNIYLTFLAASTPSWLVRAVNPDVVEGGFTSRCLFIIEEKPKRLIAWPDDTNSGGADYQRIADRLHKLTGELAYVNRKYGGVLPTDGAKRTFQEWYSDRTLSTDAFASTFQSREDHHILRLAGLMAISDNTWEISDGHIRSAIRVVDYIRRTGVALFGSGIQTSRLYSLVDRLRHVLVNAGRSGLSQSALSVATRKHGSRDDMNAALHVMHELNMVQQFKMNIDRGRPITLWRATKLLASNKALETVVDMLSPTEG